MKFKKRNRAQKANAEIPAHHMKDGTVVYANRFVETKPGVFRDIKLLKEHDQWKKREKARLEKRYAQTITPMVEGEEAAEGTETMVANGSQTLEDSSSRNDDHA